jgi:hypothetical protein
MWLMTALVLMAADPAGDTPRLEGKAHLLEERPSLALPAGLMVTSAFILTVSLAELALFAPLLGGGRLLVLLIGMAGGGVALAIGVVGAVLLARAMWARDRIDLELERLDRPVPVAVQPGPAAMLTIGRF